MGNTRGNPAQLGADNVIRFLDAEHFLKELAGHLGRGRALVRTRRTFAIRERLSVEIEAPGVPWRVACEAEVVTMHKGYVSIEFLEFEDRVLPDLDALGDESERKLQKQVPSEKTVIGPVPKFPSMAAANKAAHGAAQINFGDDEPESGLRAPRTRSRRRRPPAKPPTPPPKPSLSRSRPSSRSIDKAPHESSSNRARPSASSIAMHERSLPPEKSTGTVEASSANASLHDTPTGAVELLPSVHDEPTGDVEASALIDNDESAHDEPTGDIEVSALIDDDEDPSSHDEPTGDIEVSALLLDNDEDSSSHDEPTGEVEASSASLEDDEDPSSHDEPTGAVQLPPSTGLPAPMVNRLPAPSKRTSTPLPELTGLHLLTDAGTAPSRPGTFETAEDLSTESREAVSPLAGEADPWGDEEGNTAFEMTPLSESLLDSETRDDLGALPPEPKGSKEAQIVETELEPEDFVSTIDAPIEEVSELLALVPRESQNLDSADEADERPTPDEPTPAKTDDAPASENDEPEDAYDEPDDEPSDEDTGPVVEEPASVVEEPAPVVAPSPEPAPPPVALLNLDALEEKHAAVSRMTPGGVLRITDPVDLLGLYLSQLRHGRMTVFGGPQGEVDDPVRVKIVGPSVIMLEARILARIGDWITLTIEDTDPVRALLEDTAETWQAALNDIGGRPTATPDEPMSEPAPVIAPPPPPAIVPPAPSAQDIPAAEPEPEPEPDEPEEDFSDDDSPPRAPRLDGDVVLFDRPKDLKQEIEVNVSNGGLFVQAAPLSIRTKKALKVRVGRKLWPVEIQADVVFANGGKVGFSISNAADVQKQLTTILDAGGPESVEMAAAVPPPQDADFTADLMEETPEPPPEDEKDPSQETYTKNLNPPFRTSELLRFANMTLSVDTLGDSDPINALQMLELVIRNRWRGVLRIESKNKRHLIWFHDGSTAFVQSSPYDESTSLGRLLINHKKLNEAALREALDASRANGRSLGRSLVALGHIKKSELAVALREQVRLRITEAMELETGELEWNGWREPPGDADLVLTRGIGILGQFLRNRFESLNFSDLETVFGKNMTRSVGHDPDLDQATAGLHLQPKELRFLELQLDGRRPLRDAVLGSPIGRLASLRLVAVCLALDLVHFADGRRFAREATGLRKIPLKDLQLMKDYEERLKTYQKMNHFEVLGVHWSAHHRSYRQAFERVRISLDPHRRPLRDAPAEVLAVAKEALTIVEHAFKTLKDPISRAAYRKKMFDTTEREYAADMLVKQGEVALMRGDRVGAMECLETAVELHPTDRNKSLLVSAREGRR